jgi:hypothetical protein
MAMCLLAGIVILSRNTKRTGTTDRCNGQAQGTVPTVGLLAHSLDQDPGHFRTCKLTWWKLTIA